MNNLDKQYQSLLQDILTNGIEKSDRTGTGTISVFGRQIRHKMSEGFPLLTTKKMAWKTMVTELLWFLRGDTNIKFLVDNNCHIWDGDAYTAYIKRYNKGEYVGKTKLLENSKKNRTLTEPFTQEEFINKIKTDDEFAKKWGELGPIYGKQWRSWVGQDQTTKGSLSASITFGYVDQIQNLIRDLKNNPDSRRLMVSAWNVGELDQMVLPPCHYGFQVYTRELNLDERIDIFNGGRIPMNQSSDYFNEHMDGYGIPRRAISLMWNQRSVDTFLGLPFNIASYGLLLEIIAKEVNMVPDQLIGNLGDTHLYLNHVEQAKEQIGRELTVEERMDWWFKNRKPNRDVCDHVDGLSPYAQGLHFDSAGVPKSTREPYPLPTVTLPSGLEPGLGNWDKLLFEDFYLNDYQSHPAIKAPLSN